MKWFFNIFIQISFIYATGQIESSYLIGTWKTYFKKHEGDTFFKVNKFDEQYKFESDFTFKRIPFNPKGSTKGQWRIIADSLIISPNKKNRISYTPIRYKTVYINQNLFCTFLYEGKRNQKIYYYYFKRQ